jgi:hypothetical protein
MEIHRILGGILFAAGMAGCGGTTRPDAGEAAHSCVIGPPTGDVFLDAHDS